VNAGNFNFNLIMKETEAYEDSNAQKQRVSFPRETLAKALILAQAIKDKNGGNSWPSEQAADAVGTTRKGASDVSLTPWLQPGVKRNTRIENRFNGFSSRGEAVETAGVFSAGSVHRAEAAVLMRTGS
jgi:hypothetical protein